MKYEVAPNQEDKKEFLLAIQEHFKDSDQSIHKARNEIKIIEYNGKKYTIKSFKIPHIINQIAYTFFRASKAKKSFENALKISDFTPKPLGYIEFFRLGVLDKSYYVSEYFDYDFTIREPLLDKNFKNRAIIFQQFSKFTYELHNKGIFHKDYSPGNILIKKAGNNYNFKIVDINRMEFKELSLDMKLKNFANLWASDEDLATIIEAYVKLFDGNFTLLSKKALLYSQQHKDRKNFKKRLKGDLT